jgi:hypothetical protein
VLAELPIQEIAPLAVAASARLLEERASATKRDFELMTPSTALIEPIQLINATSPRKYAAQA